MTRTVASADVVATAFARGAAALAEPGQPDTIYRTLDDVLGQVVGHKLFTLMALDRSTNETERLYSNQPASYPVQGRKSLGRMSAWAKQVIEDGKPYLGRTAEDIRWAFFDHDLIASLGCASVINLLVVYDGELLGTVNMLHEEDFYTDHDLALAAPFAQLLAPAYLAWRHAR